METQQQEVLSWFVQFANLNLNELGPGDKAKLAVESQAYLFPSLNEVVLPTFYLGKTATSPSFKMGTSSFSLKAELLQAFKNDPKLRGMSWALEKRFEGDSSEYWSLILHLQDVVKDELQRLTKKRRAGITVVERKWAARVLMRQERDPEKFRFFLIPLTDSHDEYIQIALNQLLDGLPLSALQRCSDPGCGKYFVNFSHRKKTFCSPRCMWRFNTAERRKKLKKEDPEKYQAYLEKQRELMSKRYDKKIHAKHPKAQIGKGRKKGIKKEG